MAVFVERVPLFHAVYFNGDSRIEVMEFFYERNVRFNFDSLSNRFNVESERNLNLGESLVPTERVRTGTWFVICPNDEYKILSRRDFEAAFERLPEKN